MRSKNILTLSVAFSFVIGSPLSFADFRYQSSRGTPAEYDPGPKKDSVWVPLFADVPNYRRVGKDYTGGEKFRWNVGPMWYRGRLGYNKVKVLVVGQEGAQDENTSNRTFTGGTGTKTQNMLAGLGMDRSYLFLNTFVYTIFGQRDKEDPYYMAMEQGHDSVDVRLSSDITKKYDESPIVLYRHQLMDYAVQNNPDSLSMMVAVGGGAKDSLVTWITSRGGYCKSKYDPNSCDTSGMKIYRQELGEQGKSAPYLKNGTKLVSVAEGVRYTRKLVKWNHKGQLVIHVPHPGMARFEGGGAAVSKGFKKAADKIKGFMAKNPTWLDGRNGRPGPDKGNRSDIQKRLSKFVYKNTPVPFRDFSFGTTWRLGDGGTNTTRDGQDAIAIRSSEQAYGDRGRHDKSILGTWERDGKEENDGRPWEPARGYYADQFDYGPCAYPYSSCRLSRAMTTGYEGRGMKVGWPADLDAEIDQHRSFGFGRVYRGNTQDPAVIVLADQYSVDDFFTTRALTGEVGQRLQAWLNEQGLSNDDQQPWTNYVILRTLPFDTTTMDRDDVQAVALRDDVVENRNYIVSLLAEASSQSQVRVVTLGSTAAKIAEETDFLDFTGADEFEALSSRDLFDEYDPADIPASDLPYSTRYFMGKDGNRATTDGGDFYRFQAPRWVKYTPMPY